MKHILVAFLLFTACTQASVTKNESDREHDGFVGPVKKVFAEWSPISGWDYPAISRCRSLTKIYYQSGRLTQQSLYLGDCGSDEIRYEYSYATDGSRTEKSQDIRGKDSPPPPPSVAAPSTSDADKGEPRNIFKYDPTSGKKIESTVQRPSGKIIYKTTYRYDDKGRMIEMTGYNSEGKVSSRQVFGFSKDERVPSSFTYYDDVGNVSEKTTYSDYEFNSQGDWIKRKKTTDEIYTGRRVSLMVRNIEYYPSSK